MPPLRPQGAHPRPSPINTSGLSYRQMRSPTIESSPGSPMSVGSPTSIGSPMSIANLLNPVAPGPSSPASVQFMGRFPAPEEPPTPTIFESVYDETTSIPSITGWDWVTVDNVHQLRPCPELSGKTFVTSAAWWPSTSALDSVKAYLRLCEARLVFVRRPQCDPAAQYVLLPGHMSQPPMAFMHLEGVTPDWVFNCSKGFGLPRIIHAKLQALHINETRAPVYPIPRPVISFFPYRQKSPHNTWSRKEVVVEVVTCLNEYACEIEREHGVSRTDARFFDLTTNGGFCNWWKTKYPDRPPVKRCLVNENSKLQLEGMCDWFRARNARNREQKASLLDRLAIATREYDWKAPGASVAGFWRFWDSKGNEVSTAIRGHFDKKLHDICPEFRIKKYKAIAPYRQAAAKGNRDKLLEDVVEAMTEFFSRPPSKNERPRTKQAFVNWWRSTYPNRPRIEKFCRDNCELLEERVEGFRNRPKFIRTTIPVAAVPKSKEFISDSDDEDDSGDDASIDDLIMATLQPGPSTRNSSVARTISMSSPTPMGVDDDMDVDSGPATQIGTPETSLFDASPTPMSQAATPALSMASPMDSLFTPSPLPDSMGASPLPQSPGSQMDEGSLSRPSSAASTARPLFDKSPVPTPGDSLFGTSPAPSPVDSLFGPSPNPSTPAGYMPSGSRAGGSPFPQPGTPKSPADRPVPPIKKTWWTPS